MSNRISIRLLSKRARTLLSRKKQTGTTLVEYAFSILIFVTLIFGAMGFSHALYAYHFVNHMAKEATHWAAVNGHSCDSTYGDGSCNGTAPMNNGPASSDDVNNYVKNHAPLGLDQTKIVTSACGVGGTSSCADSTPAVCAGTPNYAGCTVQVQVGYAFNFIFPLLPTSTTVTAPCTQAGYCLSSTSEMIISH
jgi:Flp pilus assembly protein TadG